MTKHHGWCHTGCQPGPHSWWPDSVWQVQSRLPDKAPQTSCPMSCCQSDYAVSACHRLVTKHDVKKLTPLSDRAWLTWEIANFNVHYKQTFCFPSHWSWWTLGQCGVNTVLWDPPGLGGLSEPCVRGSCSYWCCKDLQYSSCSLLWLSFSYSIRK